MRSRAAVLFEAPGKWEILELEVDPPKAGEVLVKYHYAGLCHSDDHVATGDAPVGYYPFCGGHEGAGVVEAVGEGVYGVQPGDHVVASFIPGCGTCAWCAKGKGNLCDNGSFMLLGTQLDSTFRLHLDDGTDVGQSSLVSTFCEYSIVPESGVIKIDKDIPLEVAALLGCGVPTGWGSAVNAAAVEPGDVVIVIGCGGIGMNAVQGARFAGASRVIAVDPVEFKREQAMQFGATDAVDTITKATDLAQSITNGQGAASAVITIGVVTENDVGAAIESIRKDGTVVLTSMADIEMNNIPTNLFMLAMYQKRIQGALYGMMTPNGAIPYFIDLYRNGDLKLDELITRKYRHDELNQGYQDMHDGINVRGLIDYSL